MDPVDRSDSDRSSVDVKSSKENGPAVSKIEDNRVSEQSEGLETAQDSPPSAPTSEVYSLKDDSSDSILAETGLESELGEVKVVEVDKGNVAEKMKEGESDRDESSQASDASIELQSRPKQEMQSLKDDLHENSANPEDDEISPKSETAEQVKEVLVSACKNDEHEASVQRNEEVESSIDPEPLIVADISPKSGTDDEVKEVLVFESKQEDHKSSEDSELHEDTMVIPEVENDGSSSGDENDGSEDDLDDKTNDKTSLEPIRALVDIADHADQWDGSLERQDNEKIDHADERHGSSGRRDNKRGVPECVDEHRDPPANLPEQDQKTKESSTNEKGQHPVLDGKQVSETNSSDDKTARSSDAHADEGSVGAVSGVVCRLSGSKGEEDDKTTSDGDKDFDDSSKDTGAVDDSLKLSQRSFWRPLSSYFRFAQDTDRGVCKEEPEPVDDILLPIPTKGRIILYTRLGCRECKEGRLYLHAKKLGYVEINIDLYPGRKLELEKISGSPSVPKIFFNEIPIGDVNDLKRLDETGKLQEKIDYIISEAPPLEAPLPPLSGEDDLAGSGSIDELAVVVRKMQGSIVMKDRFHKMRRITNCFLGSEAVDFISEDQHLEREEAVQFARKLANNLFFHHVLEENIFEDGNHLYRFLDHDPIVSTQCYNIPRGIIDVKPRPITEIASRLRFLCYAIFDAYTSEDGRHIDYRSIHGSEEFARYVRTVEELQRVEMQGVSREERLAFFINLYNMMAIHAILVLGHPTGALERRRLFVDFQYIVGGCTYSLSTIQNGILRGNQRPPYSLMKPFGAKDKRSKVALPYPEPLTHFALICGTRSGPALRCYSPGSIDKELMDAARDFLRNGGFIYDATSNVASVTKILKWFSVDFGKTEVEVLKHAANYLEPADSEMLLDLLSANQLKVIYQPFDWGLNC